MHIIIYDFSEDACYYCEMFSVFSCFINESLGMAETLLFSKQK